MMVMALVTVVASKPVNPVGFYIAIPFFVATVAVFASLVILRRRGVDNWWTRPRSRRRDDGD